MKRPTERVVGEWTDLVISPNCRRDTTIVCKDGTVSWNRLFLASWSHLIKDFITSSGSMCAGCDAPTMILLPDYEVTMVKQMLQWSCSGEVQLESDTVLPFMSLLNALAVSVDLIQRRVTKQSEGSAKCPHCSVAFESVDVMKSHAEFCQMSYNFLDMEQEYKPDVVTILDSDMEEAVAAEESGQFETTPIMGNQEDGDQIETRDVGSDSALVDDFEDEDVDPLEDSIQDNNESYENSGGEPITDSEEASDLSRQEEAVPQTPAETPRAKVRGILARRSTKRFYKMIQGGLDNDDDATRDGGDKTSGKKTKKFKASKTFRLRGADCAVCASGLPTLSQLKEHLVVAHLHEQIMEAFSKEGLVCSLCDATSNDEASLVRHVGLVHKMVSSLVSAAVRTQLETLEKEKTPTAGEYGFKLNDASCNSCRRGFHNLAKLKRHLCGTHFGDELSKLYSDKNTYTCKLCNYSTAGMSSSCNRKSTLIHHVGLAHGKLDEFLSADVKEQLQDMKKKKRKKIKALPFRKLLGGLCKLEDNSECKACSVGFPNSNRLTAHLCQTHYAQEIIEKFCTGDTCNICQRTVPPNSAGRKAWLSQHVGISHGKLGEVLPAKIQKLLIDMKQRPGNKPRNGRLPIWVKHTTVGSKAPVETSVTNDEDQGEREEESEIPQQADEKLSAGCREQV